MKKLLGLVFNRWVLLAVLLLAIALVIWIVGPMVSVAGHWPLESDNARWMTIAAVLLLAIGIVAWQRWRARRGNAAVVSQLVAAPAAKGDVETPDMAAVRQRFEQALQSLRRARFGADGLVASWSARLNGRYLYELPWYLIIGAPGSGKTTALHHCGLKFPLAGKVGEHAVRGVGGTRHCDWWFTDRAVLIDTAGRFTTQDSDRENDRGTWNGFLALLKRSRPRQPVNGVLVTVSVVDLLTHGPAERRQYADTVRQRLQELHESLGARFPIYLMVTKSDLMAGFMDYFATLDKDQRATPWGTTFPLDGRGTPPAQRFGAEFDALQQRLYDGLVGRLKAETDPRRRASVYGFPSQFAALKAPMDEFLDTVFSPSPYEAEPMLRGVYFISGTQEGTPIDRVLGTIARSHRLERAIAAPNQSSGKSYFLHRLLSEVVFAESGLAGLDLKWERRRKLLAIGGYATVAVASFGLLAAWTLSYVHNRRYVDDVAQRVEQVRQLVQATPNRASADLLPILPALAQTRGLAGGPSAWSHGFGLDQEPKLDSAARQAYGRMLADALLPRLGLRVEEQLRLPSDAPESQYEALKTYLMLHDTEHFDAAALKTYVESDWDTQLGRSIEPAQRTLLSQHLDAMLSQGAVVSPLPLDKELVAFHRTRLASATLPQRIYSRMRQEGFGQEFPEFNAVHAAGPGVTQAFVRTSHQPLTSGVPGMFTYDGYHQGFQKAVPRVAGQLAEEQGWVLGVEDAPKTGASIAQGNGPLIEEVRKLYLNEYISVWDSYIADLRVQPITSMRTAIELTQQLSAPDSPLPKLMRAISRETTLSAAPSLIDKAKTGVTGMLSEGMNKIGVKPAAGPTPESLVDEHFAATRRLITAPEGGKAQIDDVIALIAEVRVMLQAVEQAILAKVQPPASPTPAKVKDAAGRQPEPVRAMLDNLGTVSGHITQVAVRDNLSGEVRSQIGEFCQTAAAGRYPLDRGASRDVQQADFTTLFGPGGRIDTLFQQRLTTYVDTTTRPWSFRKLEAGPLGTDSGTLPQFHRAQTIRETFFPAGGAPALRLQFKPIEMDATLKQFIIDVDGQIVRYDHGPQIPMSVQWPGPRGTNEVRIQVSPPLGGGSQSMMVFDGPWALFRLFDRVKVEPTNAPERIRATFDIDGRKALFEVTAASVRNPFNLRELSEFSCPMGL